MSQTSGPLVLGVTNHVIRRLIKDGVLEAAQVVQGAPYQIRADALASDSVKAAIAHIGRPRRVMDDNTLPMFTDT